MTVDTVPAMRLASDDTRSPGDVSDRWLKWVNHMLRTSSPSKSHEKHTKTHQKVSEDMARFEKITNIAKITKRPGGGDKAKAGKRPGRTLATLTKSPGRALAKLTKSPRRALATLTKNPGKALATLTKRPGRALATLTKSPIGTLATLIKNPTGPLAEARPAKTFRLK